MEIQKKRILTLNKIADLAQECFPAERFEYGAEVEDPHGIIVRSASCHEREYNPSLLAIARAGAGFNNIPVEECSKRGICVFNTPGGNANAVKEMTLCALIAISRNLFDAVDWLKSVKGQTGIAGLVEKEKKNFVGPEIAGKRLGIIGLGAIGTMVANDAVALGLEVYGYDPFISVESAWQLHRSVHRSATVESLAASCDILSIHVPLNEHTRNIVNAEIFAKMKPGMLLLNFARGGLVELESLRNALQNGTVRKYITDFPDDAMMDLPNTVLVPHLAASTPESEDNCASMAARELYDYLATGNIRNSVNFPNCELEPYEGGRITFIHTNTKNMLGQISTLLAQNGVNIAHMVNRSRGEYAYTMIDVDELIDENAMQELKAIEGMIRIRTIKSAY